MTRINFSNCNTIGDVERLHGSRLPARLLVESDLTRVEWIDGVPSSPAKKMLIISATQSGDHVLFEAEPDINTRLLLPFKMGEAVVTSILKVGDIFWSPDNYTKTSYSIEDLDDDAMEFDKLLRTTAELPDFSQSDV